MIIMPLDKEKTIRKYNMRLFIDIVLGYIKKFCVTIDLTDGRIVLCNYIPEGGQYKGLGEVKIESNKRTKKNIKHIATEVNKIIRAYYKNKAS